MPDWKKVMKDIAQVVEEAAREANTRQQTSRSRQFTSKRISAQKRCLFWDCNVSIKADHILCLDHYKEMVDGLIDECPGCNRAKYNEYDLCLECNNAQPRQRVQRSQATPRRNYKWYRPEYSPAWEKRDATAEEFFVYILKLEGGKFYAGQTRELRERLSEHRDGGTKSTSARKPKLVWFTTLPTREAAASLEVELKKLIDSNPREIRRMVIKFRDLVSELDYS